ncbi:MAG: cupin domain-containing protein [Chloroflexi bacterium]|nr:cupin domain-containing protein [Chloroflexota bacterium]
MEIRRFGVGHRRPDGPPRTTGVAGQVIHAGSSGSIVELAFARGATMEAHTNPRAAWFVVIEGGGWVRVADETARVAAGEAVLWPAGLDRAAWTELSEMRAIVVELSAADRPAALAPGDGPGGPGEAADPEPTVAGAGPVGLGATPARGTLGRQGAVDGHDAHAEGEPL